MAPGEAQRRNCLVGDRREQAAFKIVRRAIETDL